MTWLTPSPLGFSRIGFMAVSGSSPQASAWATCARPISPPRRHGYELFDMFCALNGATDTPFPRSHAQIAVAIQLFPAFDEVPPMNSGRAFTTNQIGGATPQRDGTACHQAREKRLPALPVAARREPVTPASCSRLRPNNHNRSERRFRYARISGCTTAPA